MGFLEPADVEDISFSLERAMNVTFSFITINFQPDAISLGYNNSMELMVKKVYIGGRNFIYSYLFYLNYLNPAVLTYRLRYRDT